MQSLEPKFKMYLAKQEIW